MVADEEAVRIDPLRRLEGPRYGIIEVANYVILNKITCNDRPNIDTLGGQICNHLRPGSACVRFNSEGEPKPAARSDLLLNGKIRVVGKKVDKGVAVGQLPRR